MANLDKDEARELAGWKIITGHLKSKQWPPISILKIPLLNCSSSSTLHTPFSRNKQDSKTVLN